MWWGGFSEQNKQRKAMEQQAVLIPMWWGGFSEPSRQVKQVLCTVLIPMWWGGFSEFSLDGRK